MGGADHTNGELPSYVAVAFAYAAPATTPLGIVGYALIMAVTSALIDDALMQRINNYVLSL